MKLRRFHHSLISMSLASRLIWPHPAIADFQARASYVDWPRQCLVQKIDPDYRIAFAMDGLGALDNGGDLQQGLAEQIFDQLSALDKMTAPKPLHFRQSSRAAANLIIDIDYFGVGNPRAVRADQRPVAEAPRLTTIAGSMTFGNDPDNVALVENNDAEIERDIAAAAMPRDCIHAFVTDADYVECSLENLVDEHGTRKLAVIHVGFPDMLAPVDRDHRKALHIIADLPYLRASIARCVRSVFLRGSGESAWYDHTGPVTIVAP
jgi:hypothetical protein